MIANDTYTDPVDAARRLYDHFWWTGAGHDEAQAAVDALDPGAVWTRYLQAQLAYTRVLFDRDPRPDDRATAAAGFRAAADDPGLHGWGLFWVGIYADNVDGDSQTARRFYDEALAVSLSRGDLLLESYAVRHLGGCAADSGDIATARRHLRRSLHLRSALGVRPQVVAAQVALAGRLDPADPERADLLDAARAAAEELDLAWLKGAIAELAAGV